MSEKDVADACKRIVFCSRSPLIIYQVSHVFLSLYTSVLWCLTYLINMLQLRRIHQELICGLWLDKIAKTNLPHFLRNSALFISALGAFYRNIIGFVLGISVVYLHKNEYNAWVHLNISIFDWMNDINRFNFFFFSSKSTDTWATFGEMLAFGRLCTPSIHRMRNDTFNRCWKHSIWPIHCDPSRIISSKRKNNMIVICEARSSEKFYCFVQYSF